MEQVIELAKEQEDEKNIDVLMYRTIKILSSLKRFPHHNTKLRDTLIDIYKTHISVHNTTKFDHFIEYLYSSLKLQTIYIDLHSKPHEFSEISNKLELIFKDELILKGLIRTVPEEFDCFKSLRTGIFDSIICYSLETLKKQYADILKCDKLTPILIKKIKQDLETIDELVIIFKRIKDDQQTSNLIGNIGLQNIHIIETFSDQLNGYILFHNGYQNILNRNPTQDLDTFLERLMFIFNSGNLDKSNNSLLKILDKKLKDLKSHLRKKFPNEKRKFFQKDDKIIVDDCLYLIKLFRHKLAMQSLASVERIQGEHVRQQILQSLKKLENRSRLSNVFEEFINYYLKFLIKFSAKMCERIWNGPTYGPIVEEESGVLVDQFSKDYKELSREIKIYRYIKYVSQKIPTNLNTHNFEKIQKNLTYVKICAIKLIAQSIASKKQLVETAKLTCPAFLYDRIVYSNFVGVLLNNYIHQKTCLENFLFSDPDKKLFHRFLGQSSTAPSEDQSSTQ